MDKILLGHGSGGRLMHSLIREHIAPRFGMKMLADSAVLEGGEFAAGKLAFTTDSYVVSPIFFPGGNIGELAVNGTVNDLSMVGAKPLYLSAGFVIEEGFQMDSLREIVVSMADAAEKANVRIVAGDTKVVDKGKGDGIFITTAGVGLVPEGVALGPDKIRPGDRIIISGSIGNHGVAVMSERNGLSFEPPVLSDTAALCGLVETMLGVEKNLRMMRDPTRGGVATTLKEIALESGLPIMIGESLLPVPDGVKGACEILGLDPLYIANEGILLAVAPADTADVLAAAMRKHPLGAGTVVIGEVGAADAKRNGMVLLKTAIGGTRIIDMLAGEQLPRIC
ncbi:MAG TPA: hydrogenase expression/formation protein HypE [Dissulfurispiraceae bacterium]|nr:hydrogenase expression/formation protein HypE [Dissulfurispiraceae bacterium]